MALNTKIRTLLDALSTVHSQKVKKAKEQRHLHNKEHFRARQKVEKKKLKQQTDLRKLFLIQGQKKEEIRSPV
ncbi:Glycoside hydrolase 2 (Mannanase, beta-galactosidase) [Saguinus oedipus]|uniref:Glycoside hydrolase 2 (Mannanase, beta-galactosidase) n=1 Tax=Saguinus oedipus TaxID=9490 RepID=A0ABQ9UMS8_SAGOE|nr:Glycoside hydrolase 2 (Mannanase, beta-galactosidase) [Saguinus oedipus]